MATRDDRVAEKVPRWATPADNEALLELVRACPMQGNLSMLFERSPDFFTLSRLQGDTGAKVAVIDDDEPGRLAAVAAYAHSEHLHVDGAVRPAGYACDLRVRPEWRGTGLYKRIYDFMTEWALAQGWDLGFTTVMKGNRAMGRIVTSQAGVVPYHHITTLRNFTVHFLLKKRPVRGIEVRAASDSDVPAMVALWNRLQSQKQFAPHLDEASFRDRLARSPGLRLEDYFLAFRDGRLVGMLATWDQEPFKRMVVLKIAGVMALMPYWYDPLAKLLGVARFPKVGEAMPYVYATQLCAETAADLQALYVHVYNLKRGPTYFFISTMLDVRDPLIKALDGFVTQAVDIEIYAMDPHNRWQDHPFNRRPVYFDPSIV